MFYSQKYHKVNTFPILIIQESNLLTINFYCMKSAISIKHERNKIIRLLVIIFLGYVNFTCYTALAQQQDEVLINGTVTDAITNQPLPGVTIVVKGSAEGTITDLEGNYSINVQQGQILTFSFIGYLNEEVEVSNQTTLNISMVEDIIGLDEVVVTGYGVQRKSDLTGAIASVSGEDLSNLPSGSFDDALKGRAAGVFATSESGSPGSRPIINIRGISSINGGDPLIIIDGVPSSIWSINSINVSDIQSVEVLKDASSQAIYGASGGNGVILITTKKGQQDKLTTELDYYFGYQVAKNNVSVCNTKEFFEIYKGIDDLPTSLIEPWTDDSIANLPNTDWQDELYRESPMQNINLAISGGNDKSTFRFSTGYFTQLGIIPNSDYSKFNVRINSEHKVSKRIKIGENATFTRDYYKGLESWMFNNQYFSPAFYAVRMHPFVEPYVEGEGPLEYIWGTSPITPGLDNPFVRIDFTDREVPKYMLKGDINLDVEIIKGLTFRTIASGGLDFGYIREFNPIYHFTPTNFNEVTSLERTAYRNYSWYLQNTLTYNFSVGNNNISLMAGFESGYYKNEGYTAIGDNLLSSDRIMHYFDAVTGSYDVMDYNQQQEVANDAIFGRINWDYKGKYLITSNIRRDRSSKFGPDYRSGIFPSFSAGWKFSEESFMQGLSWLSFGKIRAGWGKIGNSGIGVYKYFAQVKTTDVYNASLDNATVSTGVAPHGMANYELHWESMNSMNVGIDLTFFNNKLSFSADYFQKQNDGMIIKKPTPWITGTYQMNASNEGGETELYANVGEVFNKGFEITTGYKARTGDFHHNINLNFSYVENEVGDIEGDTISGGDALGSSRTFTAEGHPMAMFYGLKTDGLFQESDGTLQDDDTWLITNQPYVEDPETGERTYAQPNAQPGDVRFVDMDNDGDIDSDDETFIGNPHPKYIVGFSYELTYKMFDFSMFWQGAFGHDILQATKKFLYNNSGSYNWHTDVLDRWTPENTGAEIFRLSYLDRNDNDRFSDFYIEPGGYLRLKNIQLGCTIPENLITRLNISKLRLYVSVKDLITITKYPGIDPEIAVTTNPLDAGIDYSAYPRPIVYTFGFNVTF